MHKNRKKILSMLLILASVTTFMSVPANALSPPVANNDRCRNISMVSSEKLGRTIVWNYLKTEMNLPNSSIVGIISNMQAESRLRSDALGDAGRSYGLCQWHDSRCSDLIEYANNRNVSINDLETQLSFFRDEMSAKYPLLLESLRIMPDTKEGAYKAAYDMCMKFECPEALYASAENRGFQAAESFGCLEKECTDTLKILCNIYMAEMKNTEPFSSGPDWFGIELPESFGPVSSEVLSCCPNQTDYGSMPPVVSDFKPEALNGSEDSSTTHASDEVTVPEIGKITEKSEDTLEEKTEADLRGSGDDRNFENDTMFNPEPVDVSRTSKKIIFKGPDNELIAETENAGESFVFPEGPEADDGRIFIGWAVVESEGEDVVYQAMYSDPPAEYSDDTAAETAAAETEPIPEESEPSEEPVSNDDEMLSEQSVTEINVIFLGLDGQIIAEAIVDGIEEIVFPDDVPEVDGMTFVGWTLSECDDSHLVYITDYAESGIAEEADSKEPSPVPIEDAVDESADDSDAEVVSQADEPEGVDLTENAQSTAEGDTDPTIEIDDSAGEESDAIQTFSDSTIDTGDATDTGGEIISEDQETAPLSASDEAKEIPTVEMKSSGTAEEMQTDPPDDSDQELTGQESSSNPD